jgi:vacuolar-type H+-ATPase subunit I/STV1
LQDLSPGPLHGETQQVCGIIRSVKHMDATGRQRWLRTVILLGVVYLVVGIAFGTFAGWSASNQMRVIWRLLAFLTSGVAFAVHIGYEQFRFGSSPRITALHTSMAVALGAFALAVAANVHAIGAASSNRGKLAFALVAFPALTAVPAFVVALLAAAGLALRRRTT